MKVFCLAALASAIILAGCATDSDKPILNTGLFATYPAPIYPPPDDSEIKTADAVALALLDAGVSSLPFVAEPGPAAVAESIQNYSQNCLWETADLKTALGLAIGDSMFGKRSALVLSAKQFAELSPDLALAAVQGANAGMVIIVLTDNAGRFTNAIIPPEPPAAASRMPYLMPGQTGNAYTRIHDAFLTSEQVGLPVIVMLEVDELIRPVPYIHNDFTSSNTRYRRNILTQLLSPALVTYQSRLVNARQLGDYKMVAPPQTMPVVPDDLPQRFIPMFEFYAPAMSVLASMRDDIGFVAVEGEILSFFAFEPFSIVDAAGFDGAAVPLAIRAEQNGFPPAWVVMECNSFLQLGMNGIRTVMESGMPVKMLVFNPGNPPVAAKMFQQIAGMIPPENFHNIPVSATKGEFLELLKKVNSSNNFELVIVDYSAE